MPQTVFDKAFCNELLGSLVLQHRSWLGKPQGRYMFARFFKSENLGAVFFTYSAVSQGIWNIVKSQIPPAENSN